MARTTPSRAWPFRGYLRYAVLLAWWNVFFFIADAMFLGLVASDQGGELLRIDASTHRSLLGVVMVGSPLVLYAVLAALSGTIAAHAGTWRLEALADMFGISKSLALRLSRIAIPFFMAIVPAIMLAFITLDVLWIGAAVLSLLLVAVLTWLIKGIPPTSVARALPLQKGRARILGFVTACVLVATYVIAGHIALSPERARSVGTIGVAIVALAFWASLLTLAFIAAPLALKISSLAIVAPMIWVAASTMHDPNQFPRRPANDGSAPARNPPQPAAVQEALVRWILQFEHEDSGKPIDLFLVSAEGGGIRAAYWTGRTLTELNERTFGEFARHTFAYSGVSGGSLGVAAFLDTAYGKRLLPNAATEKLEAFLGLDDLAPLVGRLLVSEPWWQLLGSWSGVTPRDVAFERQWNSDWQRLTGSEFFGTPFLARFAVAPGAVQPVVVFNATNVETGKRVILSNVDISVARNDFLVPYVSDGVRERIADISIAEAVHLSARFPYVSPPVSLQAPVPTGTDQKSVERLWGRVVDGGYFDNSGGLIIRDIFDAVVELRTAAQRGEEVQANWEDYSWARVRPLIERVHVRVLVIRNDPLTSSQGEQNAFPSLFSDSLRVMFGDDEAKAWNDGDYANAMPSRRALSELFGPPDTMLATREARGMATRRTLWESVTTSNNDQRYACEITDRIAKGKPIRFPLEISPKCLRDSDTYDEISLGDMIVDESSGIGIPDGQRPCATGAAASTIALGWVLSKQSQGTMSCLAARSQTIHDISAQSLPVHSLVTN